MKVLVVDDGEHTCAGVADNGPEAGRPALTPADTNRHTTTHKPESTAASIELKYSTWVQLDAERIIDQTAHVGNGMLRCLFLPHTAGRGIRSAFTLDASVHSTYTLICLLRYFT